MSDGAAHAAGSKHTRKRGRDSATEADDEVDALFNPSAGSSSVFDDDKPPVSHRARSKVVAGRSSSQASGTAKPPDAASPTAKPVATSSGSGSGSGSAAKMDLAWAQARFDESSGVIRGGRKLFTCPICSKQVVTPFGMLYHINTHNPNRPTLACEGCGKTFKSEMGAKYVALGRLAIAPWLSAC